MGNQVDQLILGCLLDATEHVTQVFVGVDVVSLAIGEYRQRPGQTDSSFSLHLLDSGIRDYTFQTQSPAHKHRQLPYSSAALIA